MRARPGLRRDGIEEARLENIEAGFVKRPGNVLLSHTLTRAVPSALEGLTSEFEMGSGVAPPTSSPEKPWKHRPVRRTSSCFDFFVIHVVNRGRVGALAPNPDLEPNACLRGRSSLTAD